MSTKVHDLVIRMNQLLYARNGNNRQQSEREKNAEKLSKFAEKISITIKSVLSVSKKYGLHSGAQIEVAGFIPTGHGDTVRCEQCGLEVSDWTSNMKPFTIHQKQAPHCAFIQSMMSEYGPLSLRPLDPRAMNIQNRLQSGEHGNSRKIPELILCEIKIIQQIRRRTFSHWPPDHVPSVGKMIEAGFFSCNVGDRVICVYCDLICQQWTPHADDPCEIHRIISPKCPYVTTKLTSSSTSPTPSFNNISSNTIYGKTLSGTVNLGSPQSNGFVLTTVRNPAYIELPRRCASFATWPKQNMPSVDDLSLAGFFYTGTGDVVTCFYCNGSLQGWRPNHKPKIQHAYHFPGCEYAKQLCGNELYRRIQEIKREKQEQMRVRSGIMANNLSSTFRQQLLDEKTLRKQVAARLDLEGSQRLLENNFELPIIKRCWKDQLRLKHDDFPDAGDLFNACLILRKQIELIHGNKENIIIPSVKMRQIQEENAMKVEQRRSSNSNAISCTSNHVNTDQKKVLRNTQQVIYDHNINFLVRYGSMPPFLF